MKAIRFRCCSPEQRYAERKERAHGVLNITLAFVVGFVTAEIIFAFALNLHS